MAQARYSRIDNKRSPSSYCSTVTIVVFVALCLVGLWMMTSSVVPVQNVDESTKNEVKGQSEANDQATDTTNSNPQNFEDKKGDLPQESTKEDNNAKQSENNHVMPKKQEEKSDEKPEDKSPEDTKMTYIDPNQNKKTSDSDESNNKSGSDESNNKSGSGEDNKKSDSDESEKKSNSDEREKKSNSNDNKSGSDASENKKDESSETTDNKTEEKADQSGNQESDESSNEKKTDENTKNQGSNELLPSGAQSELLNETTTQTGSFSTQAAESKSETESQKSSKQSTRFNWKLCNVTAGPDYIPCLDNLQAIRNLKTTKHYEHRERQCPEDPPTCLVALPEGYKRPIEWPKSREKVHINQDALSIFIIGITFY